MPRFTVKDMLIAITLIAVGVGMFSFLVHDIHSIVGHGLPSLAVILFLWLGSGACIGAGLFTPFKRPWTGAVVGLVFQTGFLMMQSV